MIKKNTKTLHLRNPHNQDYDFEALCKTHKPLEEFIFINKYENKSIDFSNPQAVLALNTSLLMHFYNITFWEIPKEHLCPPIPGRADYIHYVADLLISLKNSKIVRGENIRVLDVGVGANCIYPIIGTSTYKWNFVASETSKDSFDIASKIQENNENLKNKLELRFQDNTNDIFKNIIKKNEKFDLTVCNPPFHKSQEEALESSSRKVKNLTKNENAKVVLNFSGTSNELWCQGGEVEFIAKMIKQSKDHAQNTLYFTTLVSKGESLDALFKILKKAKVNDFRTIEMKQGQKISRILVWSFLTKKEKLQWAKNRF